MKRTLLVLMVVMSLIVQAQPLLITENNQPHTLMLYPYAKFIKAGNKHYPISELLGKLSNMDVTPIVHQNTNTSFSDEYFWMMFSVKNTTSNNQIYYLETARPITDYVNLYTIVNNKVVKQQQSGDAIPYSLRDFKHRNSVFKVEIPANEQIDFFVDMKSDGEVVNLDAKLISPDQFIIETYHEQLIYGLFYGLLFLAGITYLFFYVALKERSFLFYSGYVWAVGFMQFAIDGLFYQYLGSEAGFISQKGVLLFASLSTVFFMLYSKTFLKVSEQHQSLGKVYNTIVILVTALFALVIVMPHNPVFAYPAINALALLALILVMVTLITYYIKKIQVDAFFTTGIAFLALGITVFILNNFGVISNSFITENSSKLGTGIEVIFLSLSMSNLIRKLKSEKEVAQTIALKKSEDMNELKTYFMSNMSHELRTPLNAIMGIADVMLKENIDDKIKANFEVIKYSSHGLLSSVNDILDFSKIEKGELKLDINEFEIHHLLNQIKNNTQKQATDKGLVFNYEINKDLPLKIIGDSMRLSQIINNVIGNAIKFTSVGFVHVKVDIHAKHDNNIDLQITVQDSGVGIPKDKLDSIYESFSQESINNKRKFGGLGLGLSIVKKLVDLHQGNINIESKIGQGTKCVIQLPFTFNTIIANPTTLNISGSISTGKQAVETTRILLVEDNSINQLLMKMIMQQWKNVSFAIANHGEEALQLLQQQQFDVVFMDLQMPVMDGYEAAIAIRAGAAGVTNIDIPIIALTADVMEGTEQRVKQIGMDKYMTKPVDQELLHKNMMTLVERRKQVAV